MAHGQSSLKWGNRQLPAGQGQGRRSGSGGAPSSYEVGRADNCDHWVEGIASLVELQM